MVLWFLHRSTICTFISALKLLSTAHCSWQFNGYWVWERGGHRFLFSFASTWKWRNKIPHEHISVPYLYQFTNIHNVHKTDGRTNTYHLALIFSLLLGARIPIKRIFTANFLKFPKPAIPFLLHIHTYNNHHILFMRSHTQTKWSSRGRNVMGFLSLCSCSSSVESTKMGTQTQPNYTSKN